MKAEEVAEQALVGWRAKVADTVADPLSQRLPLSAKQVRAAVGGLFFVLSVYYVIGTARRMAQQASG